MASDPVAHDSDFINQKMTNMGIDRYDSQRKKAEDKNQVSNTNPGYYLMTRAIETLIKAIRDWEEGALSGPGKHNIAAKYTSQVDHEVIALITCRIVIDKLISMESWLTIGNSIASAIEDEARMTAIKRDNPQDWEEIVKLTDSRTMSHRRKVLKAAVRRQNQSWKAWPRIDKYHLGSTLLSLVAQKTGIIEVVSVKHPYWVKGKYREQASIRATVATLKWLEESHEEHRVRAPFYLPMPNPPVDWVAWDEGGYDQGVYMKWFLFRVPRNQIKHYTQQAMPEVYEAVNHLQRTSWIVNRKVYAIAQKLWEDGGGIADLPPRDRQPIPDKPEDIATNEEAKTAWKREAGRIHGENHRMDSLRTLTARTMAVARLYISQPLWFVYKMDFRGRCYPVSAFLQPQGNDLAKGLLHFAEAEPVTTVAGRDWLAIHGANLYGEDKVTYNERILWVEEHQQEIRDVAREPLGSGRNHWMNADKPWQYLGWCMEWGALLDAEEAGKVPTSRTPVAMDGSNNGLQLFSLLLRDPSSAKVTNVTPGQRPEDIYQEVADRATAFLVKDADEADDEEHREMARAWLSFVEGKLPRSCAKRPTMVTSYSGTLYACRTYISEWYRDELASGKEKTYTKTFKFTMYLAKQVWKAIHEIVVGARDAMSWLRETADICTDFGTGITWITPSGFRARQNETKYANRRIKTKVGDVVCWRSASIPKKDELDRTRQKNGISPNFIHSLDASILHRVVARCKHEGINSVSMIHDSYGCHADHAPRLAGIIREVVAEMFSRDLLKEFADQVQEQVTTELPDLPAYGNLDPNCVLESEYFFA